MECKNWEEKIPAYLNDELSSKSKEELEKHLQQCEVCQKKLDQTKALLKMIEVDQQVEAPAEIRQGFLKELEKEKAPATESGFWDSWAFKIAASITLLIVGFAAGQFSSPERDDSELAELKNEMLSMKQMMMVSMLKDESASERIRAVGYVEEFDEPAPEVLETLFNTLNNDESPNVRLAAIKALEKFTYSEDVRLLLIKSMDFQEDPFVQISLINLMVDIEEKRSAKSLQQLMKKEGTQQIVKDQAQIGLQLLI
ncbi:MAG: HEAT repeat domain-containing protein [Cyclobacteriaceae bacterium]